MLKVTARLRHASTLKQKNLFEDALAHLPFCLIASFQRTRFETIEREQVQQKNVLKFLDAFSVNKKQERVI